MFAQSGVQLFPMSNDKEKIRFTETERLRLKGKETGVYLGEVMKKKEGEE